MIAEIFGRETGICHGKGGSMHVADFSRGILGANGIVGGGIGLAVGAALAAQLDGNGRVAVVFFGDGGANQGVVMEAINLAAIWKLPLLLVCENNGFSEFSPTDTVTAGEIAARAQPFGVPGVTVDGNDVLAVRRDGGAGSRASSRRRGPDADRSAHVSMARAMSKRRRASSVGQVPRRRGDRDLAAARSHRTVRSRAA